MMRVETDTDEKMRYSRQTSDGRRRVQGENTRHSLRQQTPFEEKAGKEEDEGKGR